MIKSGKNANLIINQSHEHLGWLEYIKSVFDKNGINCSIYKPNTRELKGKFNTSYQFSTYSYQEFTAERKRWYPKEEKIVPKDIDLTPIVLAY